MQQIEALTHERDANVNLANERQAQIEQVSNERDQQAQLATERMQQIEALTHERDANVNLANERQAQIEQVSNERNQQAQLATERMQQIEVLTHERDELNVQRNTLENKCRSIEQSVEKLATQEMQLTSELAQAKQTIALSIKLQTLKETDLRDLQQRYQAALSVQENQHKLLVQLSERLTLAADYFHKMSEQDAIVREEVPKIQKKSWWLGFFKGRDSV
jgi:chromosome segregation ATPase